uniref:Uncharacterized protein n=1 Tax=Sphaerodactylus townsendi TaxID=933632 RepID=A0ACB8E6C2_9SAUR
MKVCTLKMATAALTVLQEDLEWAKVHAHNILPLEDNTSAADIVTDLLAMVNARTAAAETAVQNSFRMYSSQLTLCSFTDHDETCWPVTLFPALGNSGSSVRSFDDDCACEMKEDEKKAATPSAEETDRFQQYARSAGDSEFVPNLPRTVPSQHPPLYCPPQALRGLLGALQPTLDSAQCANDARGLLRPRPDSGISEAANTIQNDCRPETQELLQWDKKGERAFETLSTRTSLKNNRHLGHQKPTPSC